MKRALKEVPSGDGDSPVVSDHQYSHLGNMFNNSIKRACDQPTATTTTTISPSMLPGNLTAASLSRVKNLLAHPKMNLPGSVVQSPPSAAQDLVKIPPPTDAISPANMDKPTLWGILGQYFTHSTNQRRPSQLSNAGNGDVMPRCPMFNYSCHHLPIRHTCNQQMFSDLIHVQRDLIGGASIMHLYQCEINKAFSFNSDPNLAETEFKAFVDLVHNLAFTESSPSFVLTVIHGGAASIPNPVEWLADKHPSLSVKCHRLSGSSRETLTTTASRYYTQFKASLTSAGQGGVNPVLGGLCQTSFVGAVQEEAGGYFPEYIDCLERLPFLEALMPWGVRSSLRGMPAAESDDGPIIWSRPGEQTLQAWETMRSNMFCNSLIDDSLPIVQPHQSAPIQPQSGGGSGRRGRGRPRADANPTSPDDYLLFQGQAGPRRFSEARETLIEDRTRSHADHVGFGPDRVTTAAVGILKAFETTERSTSPIAGSTSSPSPSPIPQRDSCCAPVKRVVMWTPDSQQQIVRALQIDLHEPPMTQCVQWLDEGRLVSLRRRLPGVRFARAELCADDVYFIPRRVVHQFQTIQACASIAWHVRLAQYGSGTVKKEPANPPATSTPSAATSAVKDIIESVKQTSPTPPAVEPKAEPCDTQTIPVSAPLLDLEPISSDDDATFV